MLLSAADIAHSVADAASSSPSPFVTLMRPPAGIFLAIRTKLRVKRLVQKHAVSLKICLARFCGGIALVKK